MALPALIPGGLKSMQLLLSFFCAIVLITHSYAALANTGNGDDSSSEYYTIDENQTHFQNNLQNQTSSSGLDTLDVQNMMAQGRQAVLSLLDWTLHPEAPSQPQERYQREAQFGHWLRDPNDNNCYNTRAKVLMRDSYSQVSFKETNRCVVAGGNWHDPYTGSTMSDSSDIQIDHVVPLKNAYMSGAWEWDYQLRCLYGNFLGNPFHLLSVSGHENMKKGDKAPDRYQPPDVSFRCEYLEDWLKIKLIWKLKMTPSEVRAIKQGIRDNNCNPRNFALSQRNLRGQRGIIYNNAHLCPLQ